MNYQQAREIAEDVKIQLMPYTTKCEIAGSIRRRKQEVKDIEIVAIPKPYQTGLFEDGIAQVVNRWEAVKGKLPGKYTQRILPEGIKLDLFFADDNNWGAIFLIRTGDWEFSKKFMGSILPRNGYKQEGGYVKRNGHIVQVADELELFALVGASYIAPEDRNRNALR